MKKLFLAAMCLSLPLMISGTALAIPLATYTHNYGNGVGQVDPGGNDALSNGYVTVSDQSTQRFNDSFDFSGLNFSSIDYFNLTLTYSNTNGATLNPEIWFARPGGTPDQYTSFRLNSTGNNSISQVFTIDSSLVPEFNQMVAAKNFYFWFAEETWFGDSFKLQSAVLSVDGTAPVPEPGTTLLFGLGAAGFAGVARRRRK